MSAGETEPVDLPDPEPDDAAPEGDEPEDETPDLDGPIVGEAEAEQPQARGPTPGDLRKFETENTRHEKRLAEIIGDDWEAFGACAACGGVGFSPKQAEELAELVKASGVMECPTCAGEGGTECQTCAGKGGLEYPTKVEGQRFQTCPGCGGTGVNVCVDCAGAGWKRESPHAVEAVGGPVAPYSNGGAAVPPGHILVKVDPSAPDVPHATPPPPVAAAV